MNRRSFLQTLGIGAAALSIAPRSFFDMGAAWKKHQSGLFLRELRIGDFVVMMVSWPMKMPIGAAVWSGNHWVLLNDGKPDGRPHIAIVS